MTMPPPHQPPGPYGPPQPPNPYGQQYPQQPPQPQFPQQPQQPYPGQPYPPQQHPGQGGWGQPPMGQPPMGPPRKSGAGKVIGIVAACLVGFGLFGFVVPRILAANAVTTGAGFPAAKYKLTVPKTMLDGKFKLAQDLSQTEGKEAIEGRYTQARNVKAAVAQYTAGSGTEPSVLVVSGMYGQFKTPEDSMRAKQMKGAEEGQGATLAVPAKDITPAGSDITLSCQVLTSAQDGGATVTLPMCAWADENTGASVAIVTPETAQQSPESVDLDEAAEITLKVREQMRQPIG